jgi:hypothetical protein
MSADNPSSLKPVQSMCSLLTVPSVPRLLVLRQSATPTVPFYLVGPIAAPASHMPDVTFG